MKGKGREDTTFTEEEADWEALRRRLGDEAVKTLAWMKLGISILFF